MTSKHYREDRKYREENIKRFLGNEGEVIYTTVKYDEKKKRNYRYEVTNKAVLIVKATDCDLIITKMLARPSRIYKVWENPPKEIINIAIENARNPERFK